MALVWNTGHFAAVRFLADQTLKTSLVLRHALLSRSYRANKTVSYPCFFTGRSF
jgi:hypothetical protein